MLSSVQSSVSSTIGGWLDAVGIDNKLSPEEGVTRGRDGAPSDREATLSLIYNVLSTRPVLNKLTAYTSLMSAKEGTISTHLRYCADPCWPW